MKIRNGFVSNSSSSSFLLYGIYIDVQKVIDGHNKTAKKNEQIDSAWKLGEVSGLSVEDPWDDGEVYVGLSWDEVGDNETGAQFKARAEALIRKLVPSYTGGFGTHQEAWRDG